MTLNDIVDYSLITLSTVYSVNNLETILGVILLCMQIVWLLTKFVVRIIKFSRGEITEQEAGNGIKQDLTEFLNSTTVNKEGGDDNGSNSK